MKKWIILLIIVLIAIASYNYIYKGHRNISEESAKFKLSSSQILKDFAVNPNKAQTLYLNKTIEVNGNISEFDSSSVTLEGKVWCHFINPSNKTFNIGSSLTIKGRVIGFDDLLELVKLDQCEIIK